MENINQRIFRLLGDERGASSKLAKYLDVRDSNVSSWKTRGSAIDAEYIPAIADFLNVSVDYLLTGKEEENKNKFFSEEEISLIMAYRSLNAEVKKFVFNSVVPQHNNNNDMPLVAPDEAILRAASGLDDKENKTIA